MPGVYYVSVAGTGAGDPSVDGYTSYGSLGQFWLDMAFAAGTLPPSPPPPMYPRYDIHIALPAQVVSV